MKKLLILLSVWLLSTSLETTFAQNNAPSPILREYKKEKKSIKEKEREKIRETQRAIKKGKQFIEEEGGEVDHPELAMEQEFNLTRDPNTGSVPVERLDIARKQIRQHQMLLRGASPSVANWVERGSSNVGGRTRALMFDPNDVNKKKVWAGGAGGGLWYTNDITLATPSWVNVGDVWANMAISCITYNPANTQEFYVGTGEGWGNADAIRGAGIWKTTNGGTTWTQLSSVSADINFDYVQKIVVTATGTLFAATKSRFCNRGGIFKSVNGGTSWSLSLGTQGSTCAASNCSAADLEIAVDGTIYGSLGIFNVGGIYKSTDVGTTWTQINTGTNGFPNTGLYRIEIATAPSDANRLYAMAQNSSNHTLLNIYTSNDKGATWTTCALPSWVDQSCSSPSSDMTRTQSWYDLIIAVDPNNANSLMVGGVDVMKSTNTGSSWTQISSWAGACSRQFMHADQHAIAYQPGSSSIAIFGNDGGVFYTSNATATIPTLTAKNTGYNVTQFYACAIHPTAATNYFLAGAQDNGTQKFTSTGLNATSAVTGGDGAFCFIDQTNPSYQISSYVYNNYYLTTNNWASYSSISSSSSTGDFINVADYDDANHILYSSYSSTQLQRISGITTTPSSPTQFSVTGMGAKAAHIRVSPYAAVGTTTLFVGTQNSKLFKITNAQGTPTVTNITGASFPANSSISCVEIGATENDLLVTFSNYGVVSVWRTTDGGTTWVNKEGNLPDMPIRWAIYNPNDRTEIFLATELGVWSCSDITATTPSWVSNNNGLANVRVDMFQIRSSDNELLAATHGRGLYTTNIFCTPPAITTQPTAPTATCSGTGVQSLSVVATGVNLTYTWKKNGNTLSNNSVVTGATTATITLTNATAIEAGNYTVTISGNCSPSITSDAVAVSIKSTSTSTTNTSICSNQLPYIWNGLTFTAAGTQTAYLTNSVGCDSAATLNLTIKNNYIITASAATNGSISNAGNTTVCQGNSFAYTITPNSGYYVNNVLIDGTSIGATNNYTFSNVNSNHTIAATFGSLCTPTSSTTNQVICSHLLPIGFNGLTINSAGNYTAHLTNAAGCDSAATLNLSLANAATIAAISGTNTLCINATTTVANATTGGVWSSIAGRATIDNAGVVTATSAGTATIKYSIASGSCAGSVTKNITITALPPIPSIGYAPGNTVNPTTPGVGLTFCSNKIFTLAGNPSGGSWSTTGVATISPTGTVSTGLVAGATTIKYTTAGACSNNRILSATVKICAAKGIASGEWKGASGFTMYPNPARSLLNINCSLLVGKGQIIVTNLYGKTVKQQPLSLGTNTIDIASLSKGTYFVSTITSEGKTTKKLVVE